MRLTVKQGERAGAETVLAFNARVLRGTVRQDDPICSNMSPSTTAMIDDTQLRGLALVCRNVNMLLAHHNTVVTSDLADSLTLDQHLNIDLTRVAAAADTEQDVFAFDLKLGAGECAGQFVGLARNRVNASVEGIRQFLARVARDFLVRHKCAARKRAALKRIALSDPITPIIGLKIGKNDFFSRPGLGLPGRRLDRAQY